MVKPWRNRVEMWLFQREGNQLKVLAGVYVNGDTKRCFGTFGGGVDDGEIHGHAAARELVEESGYAARFVHPVPARPLLTEWKPPYASEEQEERAKIFKGSRTTSFWGGLSNAVKLDPWGKCPLSRVEWRSINEVLHNLQAHSEENPKTKYRLLVMQWLDEHAPKEF